MSWSFRDDTSIADSNEKQWLKKHNFIVYELN